MTMIVKVYGARGSVPTCGPDMRRVGGNTSCVLVRINDRAFILDAGSGIIQLGKDLSEEGATKADLLLTHPHYDHLLGLPFFLPLLQKGFDLTLWSSACSTIADTKGILDAYMRQPFFPVTLDAFAATSICHTIVSGEPIDFGDGIIVKTLPLNHPGNATAFRFEYEGQSFSYITDFEHDGGSMDDALVAFIDQTDLAFLDATYTPEQYKKCQGFGHASWRACGEICARAGVKAWRLFHHNHLHTDEQMEEIEKAAQKEFPSAQLAREGDIIVLGKDDIK